MIPTVVGLDHLVVAVRDLDAAAEAWRALGFTLSPRGLHSTHVGSANHTMMFGEDYLELLAVLVPQPHNEALRDFLARREGLERAAFTTTDAAAGADALRARGIDSVGPLHFGRPVPMPDGGSMEARFSVFRFPAALYPAGLGIFACQHHTPRSGLGAVAATPSERRDAHPARPGDDGEPCLRGRIARHDNRQHGAPGGGIPPGGDGCRAGPISASRRAPPSPASRNAPRMRCPRKAARAWSLPRRHHAPQASPTALP